jgi:excisionase family DNA binding protein
MSKKEGRFARLLANPDILDYSQAAAFIGVSRRYMTELVQKRKVPIIDLGHRTKRFRKSDLQKVIEKRTRKAVGIA